MGLELIRFHTAGEELGKPLRDSAWLKNKWNLFNPKGKYGKLMWPST